MKEDPKDKSSGAAHLKELHDKVAEVLPKECQLTKIDMEGPQIVLYLKNMRAFINDENLITRIASHIRKKILLRSDSSVLMPPDKALEKIKELVPPEAGMTNIRFDPVFNEVIIEALKPGVVIGKSGMVLKSIILETNWSPQVLRAPTSPSEVERAIRNSILATSEERKKFLNQLGRKMLINDSGIDWVKVTALGGAHEVGRSCFLLQTNNANILLDCGINVDTSDATRAYPYLNAMNLALEKIDAVIVTHAHLDHCLHPETLIQLADGEIRKIADLPDKAVVRSADFTTGGIVNAVASKSSTRKPEMLRIKTNLSSIRSTPEHRFFVVEGMEVKEKRAHELCEGDFIAAARQNKFNGTPQRLPVIETPALVRLSEKALSKIRARRKKLKLNKKEAAEKAGVTDYSYRWMESGKHTPSRKTMQKILTGLGIDEGELHGEYHIERTARLPVETSEDFCQFLGYVLGDGNAHYQQADAQSNDLAVTDKDEGNLRFYAGLAEKTFNTRARLSFKAPQPGGRNRAFFSSHVTKLLNTVSTGILTRSRQRTIPALIHKVSNKELAGFFRGLYDAEGSVGHHGIILVSTSDNIIKVGQMLLLRFGIWAQVEERQAVNPSTFTKGPAYALTITHPASIAKFHTAIGFSCTAKAGKLQSLLGKIGHAKAERTDLVPIDGKELRKAMKEAGVRENDFRSRISRYWLKGHKPSRETVLAMIADLEEVGATTSANTNGHRTMQLQKQKALQLAQTLRLLCTEDIMWAKVRKIEKTDASEKVFDLSVPGYENFIADGLIVHNSGFIPYLYAYGYEGPTYVTPPTRDLMVLLQQDCINVMNSEGHNAPYKEKDVKKMLNHVIVRKYGEVTDITPKIRFTFHNAGHILGSAMAHLHIGEGMHNLVYSVDWATPVTVIGPDDNVQITEIGKLTDGLMKEKGFEAGYVERLGNPGGWRTIAFDPKTFEPKIVPITSFMRHPISEKLFEVSTKTGRKAAITASHSIFRAKNGRIESVRTDELKQGDFIVGLSNAAFVPSKRPVVELDEKEFNTYISNVPKLEARIKEMREKAEKFYPDNTEEVMSWAQDRLEKGLYKNEIARQRHCRVTRIAEAFEKLGISQPPRLGAVLPQEFEITKEFARFLGYFASEGSTNKNSVVITNYDKKVLGVCEEAVLPLFACKATRTKEDTRFGSKALKKLIQLIGGAGTAHTKRVPPVILSAPEEIIVAFLEGYFDGDGGMKVRASGIEISCASKNKWLIEGIGFLLLRLGIPATFQHNKAADMHVLTVYGHEMQKRFVEKMDIRAWRQAFSTVEPQKEKSAFWDKLPITARSSATQGQLNTTNYQAAKSIGRQKLATMAKQVTAQEKTLIAAPFIYDEIVSIKEVAPSGKYVYDFSVEGYENFVGGTGSLFLHNSGDMKFGRTNLFDQADIRFPKADTIIMESTYGGAADIKPRLEESERAIINVIKETVARRGKVLIPVLAVGRAQEIMLVLERYLRNDNIQVYMDGMSREASAIHTVYPEYMHRNVQRRILQNDSPFDKAMFKSARGEDRKAIVESDEPAVILAPSGMLSGGPSVEFLKMMAHDERNALIFVGYQAATSLGRKIQNGEKEVPMLNSANKLDTLRVNLRVATVDGYSGHSDRTQLLNFVRSIKPRPTRIFAVHGEESKCDDLARTTGKMLHIEARAPLNLDSIRLK